MTLQPDLRFAIRQISRHPGYAITVIVTLALAIGANTAIFSLVNALMLRDLPYQHPEKLAAIYARTSGTTPSDQRSGIDGEKWELLRDNAPSLISAVTSGASGVNLIAGSRAQYVRDERVSAHYFEVLGIRPALGRSFSLDEDRPNGPKALVLTDRIWRDVMAGDRNAIGKSILLRGQAYTIAGVLPPGTTTLSDADVYTSLQPSRQGEGGGTNFDAIVRLRDGATWLQAAAEVNRAWAIRRSRYEHANPGSTVTYYLVTLQKASTAWVRPQVEALMFASGLILLIACANLAALAIVRIVRRSNEVATRRALGASGWQIQRQFWIENLLLACIGGAVAVVVAFGAVRGLLSILPERFLPVANIPIDGRVLTFTLVVALLTSILFGMLPAVAARGSDLRSALPGRGTTGRTSLKVRQALIAGEVALTVMLLAGSGLLIRTLIHLETLPPGFNPDGVLVAKVSLDDARYHDVAAFQRLLRESIAAMRQIPGVQNAAVGLTLPYERALNDSVTFDGKHDETDLLYVTPGYFETLQMPLLAGRTFTDADGPNAEQVAIVNRAFARKFYSSANPVGRIINKGTRIVGEVPDVFVSSGLTQTAPLQSEPTVYIPAAQVAPHGLFVHVWFQPDWIVRTSGPVSALVGEMKSALASADPNLPATGFYTVNDLMAHTLATQRVEVALLGTVAALALILSAIGIFALVASMVAQRKREIGIRMALGSTASQVMIRISRSGVGASLAGLAIGLLLSVATLRVMRSVIFGVQVYDPMTLVGTVVTLGAVAVLASALPALRIARIDPALTLREE